MPSTIAFTSCIRREAFPDQPQWDDIAAADPDHLLLLGDQIYMDFGFWPFSPEWNGRPRDYDVATFRDVMADKYRQQWAEPHFRALYDRLRARDRIHAIWDDHDFAWNNAIGSEVDAARRQVAYDLFRARFPVSVPGEIYQSIDTALAQVILLDLRSHACPPRRAAGAAGAGVPATDAAGSRLLGEAQFAFLERELLARPAKPFVVIGSSLTLRDGDENWSRYPEDHARLMRAIADCGRRVILLAGDIHRNDFHPRGPGQPCHELIASGMAINYLGLGIAEDDRRNWGLLRLFEDGHAEATLVDRHGTNPCRLNW
jgi:alkaline phosphatase D